MQLAAETVLQFQSWPLLLQHSSLFRGLMLPSGLPAPPPELPVPECSRDHASAHRSASARKRKEDRQVASRQRESRSKG